MRSLFDIRETANGGVEILTAFDTASGERWEPYATTWLRSRQVELPRGKHMDATWLDLLQLEGWHRHDHAGSPMAQMSEAIRMQMASHGGHLSQVPTEALEEYRTILLAYAADAKAELDRRKPS